MRKSVYVIAAVLLLALAGGCAVPTGPEAGQDGKAAVSLAIAGMDNRSVLPNAALEDVAGWRLRGGKTGGDQDLLLESAQPTDQTLCLETGDWDFTLEGYASTALLTLEGTLTKQAISLEGSNVLRFTVAPLVAGTGTVRITIKLPSGHGIDRADVFKDLAFDSSILLAPEEKSVVFEQIDHAAGDYYYSFRLFKGADLYGVVSELVKARLNLTSAKTYDLEQQDLNLSYLIAFDLNGGNFAEGVEEPEYYRHTDAALVLPIPARLGYTFEGWHDNGGLGGEPIAKIPALSVGDKDFYANWSLDTYDIHYELYDGDNDPGNPETYTIIKLPIPLLDPTHLTREFRGWYTDPGFKEADVVTEIPAGSTGAKTFYAKWNPLAPIEIKPQAVPGDPGLTEQSVSVFVGATPIFNAEVSGYTSYQWYWNGGLIVGATTSSYTLAGNETARIHELSVVATDGSEELSAWCRVTIKANAN